MARHDFLPGPLGGGWARYSMPPALIRPIGRRQVRRRSSICRPPAGGAAHGPGSGTCRGAYGQWAGLQLREERFAEACIELYLALASSVDRFTRIVEQQVGDGRALQEIFAALARDCGEVAEGPGGSTVRDLVGQLARLNGGPDLHLPDDVNRQIQVPRSYQQARAAVLREMIR